MGHHDRHSLTAGIRPTSHVLLLLLVLLAVLALWLISQVPANAVSFDLPMTASPTNAVAVGPLAGGAQISITVTGAADLAGGEYPVNPDGSVAGTVTNLPYANPGSVGYPTLYGGDGINHYPGGGCDYVTGGGFCPAGVMSTDTTLPGEIRIGATLGSFTPTPARSDLFLIGYGTTITVPAGGATLYLSVGDTFYGDNVGYYSVDMDVPGLHMLNLQSKPNEPMTLGNYPGGAIIELKAYGAGDLANGTYPVYPDGSIAGVVTCLPYCAPGATNYPTLYGGDGINHYDGGGANYDTNIRKFGPAGLMSTDTTLPGEVRLGSVIAAFTKSPERSDFINIGADGFISIPSGGATVYLSVEDTYWKDNVGSYAIFVTPVAPDITGVSPPSITAGGTEDTPIIVSGDNFAEGATVLWHGVRLATTYVDGMTLDAVVPAYLTQTTGHGRLRVSNPPKVAALSNVFTIPVDAPTAAAAQPR